MIMWVELRGVLCILWVDLTKKDLNILPVCMFAVHLSVYFIASFFRTNGFSLSEGYCIIAPSFNLIWDLISQNSVSLLSGGFILALIVLSSQCSLHRVWSNVSLTLLFICLHWSHASYTFVTLLAKKKKSLFPLTYSLYLTTLSDASPLKQPCD